MDPTMTETERYKRFIFEKYKSFLCDEKVHREFEKVRDYKDLLVLSMRVLNMNQGYDMRFLKNLDRSLDGMRKVYNQAKNRHLLVLEAQQKVSRKHPDPEKIKALKQQIGQQTSQRRHDEAQYVPQNIVIPPPMPPAPVVPTMFANMQQQLLSSYASMWSSLQLGLINPQFLSTIMQSPALLNAHMAIPPVPIPSPPMPSTSNISLYNFNPTHQILPPGATFESLARLTMPTESNANVAPVQSNQAMTYREHRLKREKQEREMLKQTQHKQMENEKKRRELEKMVRKKQDERNKLQRPNPSYTVTTPAMKKNDANNNFLKSILKKDGDTTPRAKKTVKFDPKIDEKSSSDEDYEESPKKARTTIAKNYPTRSSIRLQSARMEEDDRLKSRNLAGSPPEDPEAAAFRPIIIKEEPVEVPDTSLYQPQEPAVKVKEEAVSVKMEEVSDDEDTIDHDADTDDSNIELNDVCVKEDEVVHEGTLLQIQQECNGRAFENAICDEGDHEMDDFEITSYLPPKNMSVPDLTLKQECDI